MKKYIIAFFGPLLLLLIFLQSCYSSTTISKEEFLQKPTFAVYEVTTIDGKHYIFDTDLYDNPISRVDVELIKGTVNGDKISIPIDSLQSITTTEYNVFATTCIVGVGLLAFVGVILATTKESCPFIYSYDGEKYVFDGEPYGGAICKALTRTDYSKLDYLKEVDGKYRLRLANEVNEIQNTDQLSLLVFNHYKNVKVIPDEFGNFYSITNEILPDSFKDSKGNNYLNWIEKKDNIYWTTESMKNQLNPDGIKDTLFLTFKNEPGVDKAKLILNAGTTLWGSQMLLQMTALRGSSAESWFEMLENPNIMSQLNYWNRREELYRMDVRILVDNQWEKRGEIIGGGPFDIDDRVVPLDLNGVDSEIKIMITPPQGFWKINYCAIDFTPIELMDYQEIFADKVLDDEIDVTSLLRFDDEKYLTHPETGDEAFLEFTAPGKFNENFNRTVFAKTTGFYELIFDKTKTPETETLNRISFEPGYPVIFSKQKAQEFRKEILSKRK